MPRINNKGFSLIELVVVAAIIGIIAAIAYPRYSEHIRRSQIGMAKAALVTAAKNMERFLARTNTYVGFTNDAGNNAPEPPRSEGGGYQLAFAPGEPAAGPPSTFIIQATAQGLPAADACFLLTIDNVGRRLSFDGVNNPTTGCW